MSEEIGIDFCEPFKYCTLKDCSYEGEIPYYVAAIAIMKVPGGHFHTVSGLFLN